MRPSKEKMHANTSIFDPSFVYRQDGYELSYKIVGTFYSIARHLSSIFPQGGAPVSYTHLTLPTTPYV